VHEDDGRALAGHPVTHLVAVEVQVAEAELAALERRRLGRLS
jgi:hypothetical protein